MAARQITERIYAVGVNDWDRTVFDALIPLPNGTSYNSYVIKGSERTALIDTVEPTQRAQFFANIAETGITKIDYLISNHAEQDHSGTIPDFLERYPETKVVTNAKCAEFLQRLLGISRDNCLIVQDRDPLSLGDLTLQFIFAPWVHWPETMFTYLQEEQALFSCDFLGSHLASDQLFAEQEPKIFQAAKRYYAEIMMPFAPYVRKHLETLKSFPLELVAPSHGPVYQKPKSILDTYRDWSSESPRQDVLLIYTSMHGSTEQMVVRLDQALHQQGLTVNVFNMISADIGELAMAAVDAQTIVFASPAVLKGLHPSIAYAALLLNALVPPAHYVALIGSVGWGARLAEHLQSLLAALKLEYLPPQLVKGMPTEECYRALDELAVQIAKKHAGR